MSRKHFVKIARDFKDLLDSADTQAERDVLKSAAERLCATFAELNSRFDRQRFLTACGF